MKKQLTMKEFANQITLIYKNFVTEFTEELNTEQPQNVPLILVTAAVLNDNAWLKLEQFWNIWYIFVAAAVFQELIPFIVVSELQLLNISEKLVVPVKSNVPATVVKVKFEQP